MSGVGLNHDLPLPVWLDPKLTVESGAILSPCKTYRYILTRKWSSDPLLPFVMLNPSDADQEKDDPTVRRCMGFAQTFGFGGIIVGNLFAYRHHEAMYLWRQADPFGPDNDDALRMVAASAKANMLPIVAAWGPHGARLAADKHAMDVVATAGGFFACLGKTKDGFPRHPLMLKKEAQLEPFP